jgi:hypothetical protein
MARSIVRRHALALAARRTRSPRQPWGQTRLTSRTEAVQGGGAAGMQGTQGNAAAAPASCIELRAGQALHVWECLSKVAVNYLGAPSGLPLALKELEADAVVETDQLVIDRERRALSSYSPPSMTRSASGLLALFVASCGARSSLLDDTASTAGAGFGGVAAGSAGAGSIIAVAGSAGSFGGQGTAGGNGRPTSDVCASSPCFNGGLCTPVERCPRKACSVIASCECAAGFTGSSCETVGTRPVCGVGNGACSDLGQLMFSNPTLLQSGVTPGKLTAGADAVVVVQITNTGSSSVAYPCFGLTSDVPTNLPTSIEPELFAMDAGQTIEERFSVEFTQAVASGTLIYFTVWANELNQGCTSGGYATFASVAP